MYHGTDNKSAAEIYAEGINVRCGKRGTDFGLGFYTTDDYDRAVRRAIQKAELRGYSPAVVKMYFDEATAEPIIERFEDDLRWGRFVINNRNGRGYVEKVPFKEHNLDARYQITIGRIADLNVFQIAQKLNKEGKLLESIDNILNLKYPQQIVFHTQYAVKYVKNISYQRL